MKKLDGIKRIIETFELLPYLTIRAKKIRVGPYRIVENNNQWMMLGAGRRELFCTRMGAMGYARAILMNKTYTALKIRNLDESVGSARTQMELIANAVSDQNDPVIAKRQQAEQRHRENMQALAYTVLNILD